MSYIPGYDYDIFISYSHSDNAPDPIKGICWVQKFYETLNYYLSYEIGNSNAVKIWWDSKRLDGSDYFDASIEDGLKGSAMMLCLVSPSYLNESHPYCKKELDLFYNEVKNNPRVGYQSRIIKIFLSSFDYKGWPDELAGSTGFAFYDDKNYFLDPTDPAFTKNVQDLVKSIVKAFDSFPKEQPTPVIASNDTSGNADGRFTIFFGETSDSLRGLRKKIITDLQKKEYNIITDIPPPFASTEHDNAVKQAIEKADLSVHLLDQFAGREIDGVPGISYPQRQTELALQFAKARLIWIPTGFDFADIDEYPYKLFLQGLEEKTQVSDCDDYIRGNKADLGQQIDEHTEQLKSQRQPAVKTEDEPVTVFLDMHYKDKARALNLYKKLAENDILSIYSPEEDDPSKNIDILGSRMQQANKLIFFYGDVSKDWIQARANAALQFIINNNCPINDFFIYMAPPLKSPGEIEIKQRFFKVHFIDDSNGGQSGYPAMDQLVKQLKGGAA